MKILSILICIIFYNGINPELGYAKTKLNSASLNFNFEINHYPVETPKCPNDKKPKKKLKKHKTKPKKLKKPNDWWSVGSDLGRIGIMLGMLAGLLMIGLGIAVLSIWVAGVILFSACNVGAFFLAFIDGGTWFHKFFIFFLVTAKLFGGMVLMIMGLLMAISPFFIIGLVFMILGFLFGLIGIPLTFMSFP